MHLKHLGPFVAAFVEELDKEAGIKEDLKIGTKKVLSALRKMPEKANQATLRAVLRVHQLPGGDKVMAHGPDFLRKMLT